MLHFIIGFVLLSGVALMVWWECVSAEKPEVTHANLKLPSKVPGILPGDEYPDTILPWEKDTVIGRYLY